MRVLLLSGSPSDASINAALLSRAAHFLPDVAVQDWVSVLALSQPMYTPQGEAADGIPADLRALHERIRLADAVILASPEHNGGPPAMLKNTIDWLSRVSPGTPWLPRPLLLLSASPGAHGGASNLERLASFSKFWGAELVGTFSLGRFHTAFDREAVQLREPRQDAALRELVAALVAAGQRGAA